MKREGNQMLWIVNRDTIGEHRKPYVERRKIIASKWEI
jgi:hypothetical protein